MVMSSARSSRWTMRIAGCGWFTTILGPGTDAAYGMHWHLDIQRHGERQIRDLPVARPSAHFASTMSKGRLICPRRLTGRAVFDLPAIKRQGQE